MLQAELELLVLAFQQGDKSAFARLYQHFHRDLIRFAASQLHGQHVAADLVQNVWLKVMKRVHRLDDPAVFTSWLYRAVRWEVLDWQKQPQQRRTEALPDADVLMAGPLPSVETPLSAAIATLSSADQLLLQLFYRHQLAQQQIALILQIPLGTVKSRLHRIRQLLAQHSSVHNATPGAVVSSHDSGDN